MGDSISARDREDDGAARYVRYRRDAVVAWNAGGVALVGKCRAICTAVRDSDWPRLRWHSGEMEERQDRLRVPALPHLPLRLHSGPRKTKDPLASQLAGLMNVKDFSKTIILAEAVGFVMWSQTRILPGFCRPSTLVMPPNRPPKTSDNLGLRETL